MTALGHFFLSMTHLVRLHLWLSLASPLERDNLWFVDSLIGKFHEKGFSGNPGSVVSRCPLVGNLLH